MKSKSHTSVELIIVVVIVGILLALGVLAFNGKSVLPPRESCISQGGKWSEGIQYGRWTQFCTYN